LQVTTSWHEKGRIEGKIEGRQEVICKFLAAKFGMDPARIQEEIKQLTSLEVLDHILTELFAANSLEEAEGILREGLSRSLQ